MLARNRGVDHLHAHFASDATTVALLAGRMSGLPFSFTAHARDIYHTYTTIADDNAMRRAKIAEAAFTVTVSDYNRSHLAGWRRCMPARIHRLYNGIDLGRFTPQSGGCEARHIVAVGRLIEKKGFADLISACAILRRSGAEFTCRIIGDGPLHDALKHQIEQFRPRGLSVEIAGPQPQEKLIGMMQEASLAVLPCIVSESGDRDGLPTVLLEAMALGTSVHHHNGVGRAGDRRTWRNRASCRAGRPVGLAASIEALLESPAVMARMGQAAGLRGEALFSLHDNVAALANFSPENRAPRAMPDAGGRVMRVAYLNADCGIPVFGDKGACVHIQEMIRAMRMLRRRCADRGHAAR